MAACRVLRLASLTGQLQDSEGTCLTKHSEAGKVTHLAGVMAWKLDILGSYEVAEESLLPGTVL